MNSPMEDRLREALAEAGATVDASTLSPLQSSGRPRVRVDFRLLAAAGAVVLAGAVTAAVLISPSDEQRAWVANPPVGQKGDTEMILFLCGGKSPAKNPDCPGGRVTLEHTRAIQQALQEVPEVTEVRYVSQTAAYLRFRRDYADNKALLDAIGAADMLPSFQVKLKPGADTDALQLKVKRLGGASGASFPQTDNVSAPGWADISVFLCGEQSTQASCGAVAAPDSTKDAPKFDKYGTAITRAQRIALGKEIGKIPGIQSMRFESQQEAYENFQRTYKDNKALVQATRPSDMPESFRLQLGPDAVWSKVIAKLQQLPGVAMVKNHKCVTEQATLYQHYGIQVPASKLCGS